MFAKHLHHATFPREMNVIALDVLHPDAVGRLEDIIQAVGRGLIGPHQTEVASFGIEADNIAQIRAHHPRGFGLRRARIFDIHSVCPKVRKTQLVLGRPPLA